MSNTQVTLREITEDTLRPILKLEVAENQKSFVAPNAVSIAQAHFSKNAWFRAIYADETPVGFVMVYIDEEKPEFFLWRYMIGAEHQRKGYGFQALSQVIEFVKTLSNASELFTSYVPGEGCPGPFYHKLGFEETGEWDEGEAVMKLKLV